MKRVIKSKYRKLSKRCAKRISHCWLWGFHDTNKGNRFTRTEEYNLIIRFFKFNWGYKYKTSNRIRCKKTFCFTPSHAIKIQTHDIKQGRGEYFIVLIYC